MEFRRKLLLNPLAWQFYLPLAVGEWDSLSPAFATPWVMVEIPGDKEDEEHKSTLSKSIASFQQ